LEAPAAVYIVGLAFTFRDCSQELLAGQVVGKLWMTLLALPVLAAIRPRLQPALTR
jgi:hypothetical protein